MSKLEYSQASSNLGCGGEELTGIADQVIAIGEQYAQKDGDAAEDIANLKTTNSALKIYVNAKVRQAISKVRKTITEVIQPDYASFVGLWKIYKNSTGDKLVAATAIHTTCPTVGAVFVTDVNTTVGRVSKKLLAMEALDYNYYKILNVDDLYDRFKDNAEKYCVNYADAIKAIVDSKGDKSLSDLKAAVRKSFSALYSTLDQDAKHKQKEKTLIETLNEMWKQVKKDQDAAAQRRQDKKSKKKGNSSGESGTDTTDDTKDKTE